MDEVTIRRAEAIIDLAAALAFGAAAAWPCLQLGFGAPAGAGVGVAAFAAALASLHQVRPEAVAFRLAQFDPRDLGPDELLLTEADRPFPALGLEPNCSELMLDDALPPADPDSRVVRLFDASAMPTPGELKSRIDRHLGGPPSAPPDASQALFDALAELRGALR